MLVDDLDLPTYVHSVLSRAGIERVSDLLAYTTKELMAVPGLGQKSLGGDSGPAGREGLDAERVTRADEGEEVLLGDGIVATKPRRLCWAATLGGDSSKRSSRREQREWRRAGAFLQAPGALLYFAAAARPDACYGRACAAVDEHQQEIDEEFVCRRSTS